MIPFLRLFRDFREMERNLQATESARIKADDEVRFWRGRADWAESDRDRARLDLAGALKSISNWQALLTGAPILPFPEVAHAQAKPAAPEFGPIQPQQSRSMRDLQNEAVAKSRKAAAERRQALSEMIDNGAA